ncbi:DUF7507 domain-containing protein [Corynebacterium kalinowskii]|uniref:DUF7507 domain-containing protein n=1 Tax=Corynebacterium kalinowskii TaxID=2675216 RepID=UPI0012E21D2F|nr:DUF11 domain-containing protein [Corynebacterium kalinowskii]
MFLDGSKVRVILPRALLGIVAVLSLLLASIMVPWGGVWPEARADTKTIATNSLSMESIVEPNQVPAGGGQVAVTYKVTNTRTDGRAVWYSEEQNSLCNSSGTSDGVSGLRIYPGDTFTFSCEAYVTQSQDVSISFTGEWWDDSAWRFLPETTVNTHQVTVDANNGNSAGTCDRQWYVSAIGRRDGYTDQIGYLDPVTNSMTALYDIPRIKNNIGFLIGDASSALAQDPKNPRYAYFTTRYETALRTVFTDYLIKVDLTTGDFFVVGKAGPGQLQTNRLSIAADGALWSFGMDGVLRRLSDVSSLPATKLSVDTNGNAKLPSNVATLALENKGTPKLPAEMSTDVDSLNSGDIVFDGTGTMWILVAGDVSAAGAGDTWLLTIGPDQLARPSAPEATLVGNMRSPGKYSFYNGISFDSNGTLYASANDNQKGSSNYYSVNKDTGVATPLNEFTFTESHGFADMASCALPQPDLAIEKTATPESASVGDTITFSIVMKNTGNLSVSGATFEDQVPHGAEYIEGSTTLNGDPVSDDAGPSMPYTKRRPVKGTQTEFEGVIPAGDTATVTFQVRMAPGQTEVCNQANVVWVSYPDGILSDDPNKPGGEDPTCVTSPDFAVRKESSDLPVVLEKDATEVTRNYSVIVKNTGNDQAMSKAVMDTPSVPAGFVIKSITVDGNLVSLPLVDGKFEVTPGDDLAAGAEKPHVVVMTYTVDQSKVEWATIGECKTDAGATDSSKGLYNVVDLPGDSDGVDNNDVCTPVTQQGVPGINIVKKINGFDADSKDAAAVVAVGSDMSVTFEVTNTGDVPLTNVTVTDDKIAASEIKCDDDNVVDVLLPGAWVTCSATMKAPAADTPHVNVGTVSGDTPGTTVPGTTDATTTVPGSTVPGTAVTTTNPANAVVPEVSIKKYINGDDANVTAVTVPAGQDMDVEFRVKNTGQKDLSNVTVTDDKVAAEEIVCEGSSNNVLGVLKVGEEKVCKATFPAPPAGSEHVNVGTVAGEVPPTSIPGTTVPESTVPGTTDATTTVPGSTVPGTTDPGTSVPATTLTTTDPATATVTTTPVVPGVPGINIVKKINGFDADSKDAAAVVAVGSDMSVTFEVTNTGDVPLTNVTVTDDKIAASEIKCDDDNVVDVLLPGAWVTCSATMKAPAADTPHVNVGTVSGDTPGTTVPGTTDATTTVPGSTVPGTAVTTTNPANAVVPEVSIKKYINGDDANVTAVTVPAGQDMDVEFRVKNTGQKDLSNVTVTDDKVAAEEIVCEGSSNNVLGVLKVGEEKVCKATFPAPPAGSEHVNVGTVAGEVPPTSIPGTTVPESTVPGTTDATTTVPGSTVPGTTDPGTSVPATTLTTTDPATATVTTTPVVPGVPGINIVKKINGFDADSKDAAAVVAVGSDMSVTFEVTNTGDVPLTNVTVTDDKIAASEIKCDDDNVVDVLLPGAWVTCSATMKAPAADTPHVNVGTVSGDTPGTTVPGTTDATTTVPGSTVPGTAVTTTNPANAVVPEVSIKKYINGDDANVTAVTVPAGQDMDVEFRVKNTGQKDLSNVTVTDDKVAAEEIVCEGSSNNVLGVLKVGEEKVCKATFPAPPAGSEHVNVGTVAGEVPPTSIPGTTVPESTVPGTTDATTTVPGSTVPGTTDPGTSVPATTLTTTDPATATVTTTPVVPGVPGINIVKKINGFDADSKDAAAVVAVGSDMSVTFEVTNTGDVPLTNVTVTDDKIAASEIKCDDDNVVDVLLPGAWVTCSATMKAPAADTPHVNVGTVSGDTPGTTVPGTTDATTTVPGSTVPGTAVTTTNPANAVVPEVSIKKYINGDDANVTAVTVPAGQDMDVEFRVKNTGQKDLSNVTVTDDKVAAEEIVCEGSSNNVLGVLKVGEEKVCKATFPAPPAGSEHVNVGTVAGEVPPTSIPGTTVPESTVPGTTDATTTVPGSTVPGTTDPGTSVPATTLTTTDPATATVTTTPVVPGVPGINIVKKINGFDADSKDAAAVVAVGSDMSVTFEVTNTGDVPLTNVTVTDDKIAASEIKCDDDNVVDVLLPGAWVTCSATMKAPAADTPHVNVGTVSGDTPGTTVPGTTDATTTVPGSTVPGTAVTTTNPANAVVPEVSIKKYINGDDANVTAVTVPAGQDMDVEFRVKNTGQKDLSNVTVTDDKVAAEEIVCEGSSNNVLGVLKVGEEKVCKATFPAPPAGSEHVNVGTVAGEVPPTSIPGTTVPESTVPGTTDATTTVPGSTVPGTTDPGTSVPATTLTTTDPATATVTTTPVVPGVPGINIVKKINGFDADSKDAAAVVAVGSDMSVTFEVTNTGDVPLTNVTVTDDKIAASEIKCDDDNVVDVLLPGAWVTCSATMKAPAADTPHVNVGTVSGDTPGTTVPGTTDATTTVPGSTVPGTAVTTTNPANAVVPEVSIKKYINGDDANVTAVTVPAGQDMDVEFRVKNTGQKDLSNVTVTDDKVAAEEIVCEGSSNNVLGVLKVGEEKVCKATFPAPPAGSEHVNVGTVAGEVPPTSIPGTTVPESTVPGTTDATTTVPGSTVPGTTDPGTSVPATTLTTTDPATATVTTTPVVPGVPGEPGVDIKKFINGRDADTAGDAAVVKVGDMMQVEFRVVNTGQVALRNVTVTDDKIAASEIKCDDDNVVDVLMPGGVVICKAEFAAPADAKELHTNVGSVGGEVPGTTVPGTTVPRTTVSTTNPANAGVPAIDVLKQIKDQAGVWQDADTAEAAAVVKPGADLEVQFLVTNTGQQALHGVTVTDDKIKDVVAPSVKVLKEGSTAAWDGTLAPGESGVFTAKVVAADSDAASGHVNVGTALGTVTVTPSTIPGTTVPESTVPGTTDATTTVPGTTVPGTTVGESTVPGTTVVVSTTNPAHATESTPPTTPPVPGTPKLEIQKLINGDDADNAPGVEVKPGAPMTITYEIKNTGDTKVFDIHVVDRVQAGDDVAGVQAAIDAELARIEKFDLAKGEAKTVTITVAAPSSKTAGHLNVAKAVGTPENPEKPGEPGDPNKPVESPEDPGNAHNPPEEPKPSNPAIHIVKMINGTDNNSKPGVRVEAGSMMAITYKVTNTGDVNLTDVQVTDTVYLQDGVEHPVVTCPKTELAPGEEMTCTSQIKAPKPGVGHYDLGRVEGTPPSDGHNPPTKVRDEDPEFAHVDSPAGVQVIKKINGDDANNAPGVIVKPGEPMSVTFEVTNTGKTALKNVTVTDDKIVSSDIVCAGGQGNVVAKLEAGASFTCTATFPAPAAGEQHTNTAKVEGTPEVDVFPTPTPTPGTTVPGTTVPGTTVPGMTIPGTTIPESTVPGTTNATTTVPSTTIPGTTVPETTEPGTTVPGTTVPGTTVPGEPGPTETTTPGPDPEEPPAVVDHDPANAVVPAVRIVKLINGDDADTAPGVAVEPGSDMTVHFQVTNTGLAKLKDIKVTDNVIAADKISCPKTELEPGASMTCTATYPAPKEGEQHTNVGTVEGTPANPDGSTAVDEKGHPIPPVKDDNPANAHSKPGIPPWVPLIPLIPLIPLVPGSSGSSGSSDPVPPAPATSVPQPAPTTKPNDGVDSMNKGPQKGVQPKGGVLAKTGANVIGISIAAALIALLGFALIRRRKADEN